MWDYDDERIVISRSVHLNERPPDTFHAVSDDSSCSPWVVSINDHDSVSYIPPPRPVNENDHDATADVDDAADVEMEEVPPTDAQISPVPTDALDRGSNSKMQVVQRISSATATEDQQMQLAQRPDCDIVPHSQHLSRSIDRPAIVQHLNPSLDLVRAAGCDPCAPSAIIPHGEGVGVGVDASENRIVFSGGSIRPRSITYEQPRLLTDGDMPLHLGGAENDDEPEPESKRPRLDEYEIALAVSELPTS